MQQIDLLNIESNDFSTVLTIGSCMYFIFCLWFLGSVWWGVWTSIAGP